MGEASAARSAQGRDLAFRMLTLDDFEAAYKLQSDCLAQLAPENKSFVVPKRPHELRSYLTNDPDQSRGLMLGAFSNGALIASGILALPERTEDEVELGLLGATCPASRMAVLKGAYVHPDHRRHHLHRALIHIRISAALIREREHIITEIAIANTPSLKGYFEANFKMIAIRYDRTDQTPLYYLYAPLQRPRFRDDFECVTCDDRDDISFQEALLQKGFLGSSMAPGGAIVYQRALNSAEVLGGLLAEDGNSL